MNLLFWGLTMGVVGKVLLGVAVLRVHLGVMREHKIDDAVIKVMKREKWITIFALFLILVGYLMEITFYEFTPLLHCGIGTCGEVFNTFFSN